MTGEVVVQGSKNAALPVLTATVLIQGKTVLHNCPQITDIEAMLELLTAIGCVTERSGNTVSVDATRIFDTHCPKEQVQAMRSSIMLVGPMLGRCKSVCMNRPGGCVIGARPIDIHEEALSRMNVCFEADGDMVYAHTGQLTGAHIRLPFPSVGATENVVMAAVLAKGKTCLTNAAKEPEIGFLCEFLNRAGARIKGIGSSVLEIEGVESLREVTMTIMSDRIVAGTYLLAAAATRGQILLRNAPSDQLQSLIKVLCHMGASVLTDTDLIYIDGEQVRRPACVRTEVYPGFPTDLQSMLIPVLAIADGESIIEETIFEDRFKIVPELQKMGAVIREEKNRLYISGVRELSGAGLEAFELRGGAALVIAGLCARGESEITGYRYIRRGYENICRDLRKLSADIWAEEE